MAAGCNRFSPVEPWAGVLLMMTAAGLSFTAQQGSRVNDYVAFFYFIFFILVGRWD
jgi:hypothetical protein